MQNESSEQRSHLDSLATSAYYHAWLVELHDGDIAKPMNVGLNTDSFGQMCLGFSLA